MLLLLWLHSAESAAVMCSLYEVMPLAGRVLINPGAAAARMSPVQLKGVATVMQTLPSGPDDARKAWFVEMQKVSSDKNLKIFYLALSALERVVHALTFAKLPDPREFLVGVTLAAGHLKAESVDMPTFKKRLRESRP